MKDLRFKILAVDDDELSQDLLKVLLSKKFEIYTATGVNSFYNLIENTKFDLILMDISLRDYKDGLQLTRELKMNDKHKQVPVIVLTSFNTTKERHAAIESGADLFVAKPVQPSRLVEVIESTLEKYHHI